MKIILKIIAFVLIPFSLSFPQEERNVLAEIFTNSHCPPCVSAHNMINNYLETSPNSERIVLIFYHMIYPYNDDPLYHHNPTDSDGRDEYYNPIHATPRGFFDGEIQGSVSTWASSLDNLANLDSPLRINLTGTKMNAGINIKADINRSGNIPDNDLVIHFVVVEDLNYTGRNGISHHENVMRKMVDGAFGYPFSININETKQIEREITFHPDWIKDSLKVVVFIQSDANKTVYQSAIINYSEMNDPTDVSTVTNLPDKFRLEQNYPNPFNPSTNIKFSLNKDGFVILKLFDITGREIQKLISEQMTAGKYEYKFDASKLASGIYFYRLSNGVQSETQKMVLMK